MRPWQGAKGGCRGKSVGNGWPGYEKKSVLQTCMCAAVPRCLWEGERGGERVSLLCALAAKQKDE